MEVKFQLKQRIEQAHRIVFLGGAGVSTASGLPDFRSDQTQHRVQQHYGVSVETLLSYRYFYEQPEQVYDYLNTFLHLSSLKPNAAHRGLVCLEQKGYPLTIITQNIDGLHQAAGSHRVLELHGNLRRFYCSTCEKNIRFNGCRLYTPRPLLSALSGSTPRTRLNSPRHGLLRGRLG